MGERGGGVKPAGRFGGSVRYRAMTIRTVAMPSIALIAICRKCGKKLGGGFGGGGTSLAKALRKELGLPKPKLSPVRIVETGCMKLCPKRAVAVMTSREPGTVFVVPGETPVAEVAARLGIAGPPARTI